MRSRNETEITHTYTLYAGVRPIPNLELYANPELALGNGVSRGQGLAGYGNGDLIGQQALRPLPYLARYFVRWRVPMPHMGPHKGGEEVAEEETGRALNIIPARVPAHRLVITLGKFAISDIFDTNSYANNPRTQFLNNAFGNNLAYDYAEEVRGYDLGASAVWVNPAWAARFGTFAMPTAAGGANLAYNWTNDHSEQIEADLHLHLLRGGKPPFIVRLLGWRNVGNMGRYQDALSEVRQGAPPSLTAIERVGTVRMGAGVNFEQALADGGATGIFGRLGWADGSRESYNFAECDQFYSLAAQVSGIHWRRRDDRVGIGCAVSGISRSHRDYLGAGGVGLALGDGGLSYGDEQAVELYYSYQAAKPVSISLDFQSIADPGYNRARGPVALWSVRAHAQF
ncbi:MAG TPA: carbohydrate porin [Chthonomonadales bacterium]|nr:carbohydrate porin [Chthonomonadales bacterium]